MVESRHALLALSAVFRSQRSAAHALDAEIGTVQLARVGQLFYSGARLGRWRSDVARVGGYAFVEVVRAGQEGEEEDQAG